MAAAIDRSRLALLAGDISNARHAWVLAASLAPPSGTLMRYSDDLDDLEIAGFRIALVATDEEADVERIETALRHAENSGRARRAVRLAWLLAQAYHRAGHSAQALIWLERALAQGQAWQAHRIFADEPWHLQPLRASRQHVFDPRYLERLVQAAQVSSQRGAPVRGEQEDLLSPRELQIIRRVADGHSNKALARLLFVSENTIETHLRRINGKLSTGNRMQAVARARELGLL
ncbi:helix-turn-helix domain-containing protein [Cupriavidus basilensis]